MARSEPMPITPEVLTWAREWSGVCLDNAEQKFKKIADWESGTAQPTYVQLEHLADTFRIPVSVFFFPEPPAHEPLSESFRTLGPQAFGRLPSRMHLLIRKARAYQISLEELFDDRNPSHSLITHTLQANLDRSAHELAADIHEELGVTIEQQPSWPNDDGGVTALDFWRSALWNAGVYVFKDQFRLPEYSGFSLYHEEFPIIYVNKTNPVSRQISTLMFQFVHLLFKTSGIDASDAALREGLSGEHRKLETRCHHVASLVLTLDDEPRLIPSADDESSSKQRVIHKEHGISGNYYRNKADCLGKEFVSRAFSLYHQGRLSEGELAGHLDVKQKHLEKLEQYALA